MFTEYINAKIFYDSGWAMYEAEMAPQEEPLPNQNSVLAQNNPDEFMAAQEDPAAMEQQPQQMDPNAASLSGEAEDPDTQFEPIKKLMLIHKIRQLQDKLQDRSISIEELNTLLQFVNFLSYDTILGISEKIIEFVNSYIKSITKEK
jgi:hypothetical protein